MGNDGPPEVTDNRIGKVRQSNLHGRSGDDEEWLPVELDDGVLKVLVVSSDGYRITDALERVGADELRTRLYALDGSDELQGIQAESLDTDPSGDEYGQFTYLSRALESLGEDSVRVSQADASEKSTVEYGLDIESDTDVTLDIGGHSAVEVKFLRASSSTDVAVEESWDDSNWEEVESDTDVTEFEESYTNATSRHVRLSITGTGGSGDTADVIVAAAP